MAISIEKTGSGSQTLALSAYMSGVYTWMCAGLLLTAMSAWLVSENEFMMGFIFGHSLVLIGLIVIEFALVIGLSIGIRRMSAAIATAAFVLYSIVNGLTLSSIFIVYQMGSIASAFLTSAGMFGTMSVWGWTTRRDLTGMGSFMMAGLFGIIIAMLVNFFLRSEPLGYVISILGVIIFLGLTAYDTQKLKALGMDAPLGDSELMRKGIILGALTLYLDFINLFLMLLRLFGNRR